MGVDAARRKCGILSSISSLNLSCQQHLALALSVTGLSVHGGRLVAQSTHMIAMETRDLAAR